MKFFVSPSSTACFVLSSSFANLFVLRFVGDRPVAGRGRLRPVARRPLDHGPQSTGVRRFGRRLAATLRRRLAHRRALRHGQPVPRSGLLPPVPVGLVRLGSAQVTFGQVERGPRCVALGGFPR